MHELRVLGVIPARGGSRGVPGKNIRPLAGVPLIGHTIRAAAASQRLSAWLVSTDDPRIAAIAREMGAPVPFLRPPELATDDALAIPVLIHALGEAEASARSRFDAVMMLQPTTPFRTHSHIDEAVGLLRSTGADSVISVVDVGGHHPARTKYLHGDRLIDPPFCEERENQPRQELPPMYIRNGAVYLTRREVLVEQRSLKGRDSRGLVMPATRSVNIDTEDDFAYAEWIHERHFAVGVEVPPIPAG